MKTIKFIIALAAVLLFVSLQTSAAPKENSKLNNKETGIQQIFNKAIAYPESAKSAGIEGFVLIQYHISQLGRLKIDAINGSNSVLVSYVQTKLDNFYMPDAESKPCYAKFVFKLL